MKRADISPLFKTKNFMNKENYRSVNVLPVLSKIFERLLADQITHFMMNKLSHSLSAYRKGYSCQHVLINMTEFWKQALDDGKCAATVTMDLYKAFDCMPHGLLIAKLHAYGFTDNACSMVMSYLINRCQRVKTMGVHSEWATINRGVPQGSVLGHHVLTYFWTTCFLYRCKMH